MKIDKHEYSHRLLVVGEDRVFASAPIAMEGGRFHGAWATAKIIGAADQNIGQAVIAMGRGVVAIQADPDDGASDIDEVWDRIVPKDEAFVGTAATQQVDTDIDVGSEDTDPFGEPGIPNPNVLAESSGIWAERVWDWSHIFTFADTSDGFKDATPDTYIPNTVVSMQASKNVTMTDIPGYAMFAFGNPGLTQTTSVVQDVLEGREYLMLRHLTRLLDEFWMQMVGLDEAGAESPYIDIAALIIELTEPVVQEETAGAWASTSYNVWAESHVITSVPRSDIVPSMISAG